MNEPFTHGSQTRHGPVRSGLRRPFRFLVRDKGFVARPYWTPFLLTARIVETPLASTDLREDFWATEEGTRWWDVGTLSFDPQTTM